MVRSTKDYDRWIAHEASTWSLQVFLQYDSELMGLWGTHISSSSYTYQQLGASSASWSDKLGKHFRAGVDYDSFFPNLKEWSDAYNGFSNWVNLSVVLTLSSNLETYIASVIRLALESDPALLVGVPRAIDGAYVQKHGQKWIVDIREHLDACTKGDWSARLGAIQRVFGSIPNELRGVHSDLEELRAVRNRFGHAFGRDIDEARRTGTLDVLPMEKMTRKRVERLRRSVTIGAKSLDKFLLERHIGEFEAVQFYANLYPSLHKHVSTSQRAAYLKKAIGTHGATPRGKCHCNGLVEYWETL